MSFIGNMDALFVRSLLRDAVLVKPMLLGSNYREMVQQLTRNKVEGVCSRHGFVMPGSVAVHKVAHGRLEAVSLNGDVRFDVQYHANVCNPPIGAVMRARVINANKFGVLAHSGILLPDGDFVVVVETIVTKQPVEATAASEVDLDGIVPGDEIYIEILGKKFELNDTKISVIGRAVKAGTQSAVLSTGPVVPRLIDGGGYGRTAEDEINSDDAEDEVDLDDVDDDDVDDDDSDGGNDEDDIEDDDDEDEDDANGGQKAKQKSKLIVNNGDGNKPKKKVAADSLIKNISYDTDGDDDDEERIPKISGADDDEEEDEEDDDDIDGDGDEEEDGEGASEFEDDDYDGSKGKK